jgi:hypothetical protein
MTDLLITTILAGLAVTYAIEFLDLLVGGFFGKTILNKWLSLPLSFGAVFSQLHWDTTLIIAVPAATFIAVAVGQYLNKPVVTNFNRLTRGL